MHHKKGKPEAYLPCKNNCKSPEQKTPANQTWQHVKRAILTMNKYNLSQKYKGWFNIRKSINILCRIKIKNKNKRYRKSI